ncbi:hypothetical protein QYF36_015118 [Acer negundo]|nr:hypothetical protein QYF36_015118 [Acer negundo]
MVTIRKFERNKFLSKFESSEQLKCSLFSFQGIKTPIYYMGSQSLVDNTAVWGLSKIPEEEQSLLDALLLSQWEERMWKGRFRYDVTTSEIKVISGRGKFLAQLNEGWNMDYLPKAEDNKICQQIDPFIFHCMNHDEELLFCVASSEKANSEIIPEATVPNGAILIIINASPAEYGHVFLVPWGSNRIYQFDVVSLEMMLRVSVETNNPSFHLFYDSSSPAASHLYFQACYFPDHLPVELMPVDTFFADGRTGTHISTVMDYPINALLFECTYNIKMMVEVMSETCSYLQEKNIPYSILISDCGKKIFLFLQTLGTSCKLSAWECSGYFLFRSRSEFDQVTERAMRKHLSAVSLDDEGFQTVKQLCFSIASKLAD